MINISVSQATKLIGVRRKQIQDDIKCGILHTHEGLVNIDSLQRAYPNIDLDCDFTRVKDKYDKIKKDALLKINKEINNRDEREKELLELIDQLQAENSDLKYKIKEILCKKS